MRAFDQGGFFRVTVSADEVYSFMYRWPCSGLNPNKGVSFTFDKLNGDLVDVYHPGADGDSAALVALCGDARTYGCKRLKLDF